MSETIKRTPMTELAEPPDGADAELVTAVQIYGNQQGWKTKYWDKGEVGVLVPYGPPDNSARSEFHHYPKDRVYLVSPQKDLEAMLADAYAEIPALARLHKLEEVLKKIKYIVRKYPFLLEDIKDELNKAGL